jgi:hypothetical protein
MNRPHHATVRASHFHLGDALFTLAMPSAAAKCAQSGSSRGREELPGRATAPIEDIWREKIGGCSYREAVRPTIL